MTMAAVLVRQTCDGNRASMGLPHSAELGKSFQGIVAVERARSYKYQTIERSDLLRMSMMSNSIALSRQHDVRGTAVKALNEGCPNAF
jgi:hypothetical protein